MAPRWSEDMTVKFMKLYTEHECLWDQFNELYKNKFARKSALLDIASQMNIEGFGSSEVNQKIKALRATYHSEMAKHNSSKKSGCAVADIYTPTLKWFDLMKHIIAMGTLKRTTKSSESGSHNLSYLVRLDRLSEPLLYPEHEEQPTCHVTTADGGPPGHAKLRITGCRAEEWAEFVNNHGYLRRDKVQERFVELLAQSAARSSVPEPPSRLDESRLCGSPGKVVDPAAAYHIISTPPQEQFYFGAADCHRHCFPDPREFRLAIVEGTPCVRLRVGLLPPLAYSSSEEDIQVTLTLGIGFTGWPQGSDFPARVPLSHVDILLYQQAANMGFYLVPAPPHPTARCDDRSASWQFRFPAPECSLLAHYAPHSVPARVLAVLRHILAELRRTTNGGHVVSDYMLKTFLWFRLEEDHESLVATLHDWDHHKLSTHVLVILDELMGALRTQRHRSYWMPWFNVMLSAPGGGTPHYTEEDYCHDAETIGCQLRRLLEPTMPTLQSLEPWQMLDSRLVTKWQDVLLSLSPPNVSRSRRPGFAGSYAMAAQYSARQLQYVRHVLRGMLTVRAHTLYQEQNLPSLFQNSDFSSASANNSEIDSSEDLIYLLSSILEQANALHLFKRGHESKRRKKSRLHTLPKRDSVQSGKRMDSFEMAVGKLMDEVRMDTTKPDLTTDTVLVKEVLKWLYYGMNFDRQHLFPVLRPYLNRLFTVSHESCWHIDEWKRRQDNQELFALGSFARLVVEEGLPPRDGISDAIQKGWQWGERVLESAAQSTGGVELIFTPIPGRVLRYRVRLHRTSDHGLGTRSLGRNLSRSKADAKLAFATLPRHANGLEDLLKAKELNGALFESVHARLRGANPIANAIDAQRRYGTHRGLGSIVEALVMLNKFSVLQEVSNLLPEDERAQVLDDIQRVSKERRRGRRLRPGKASQPASQLYRPVPEQVTADRLGDTPVESPQEWVTAPPATGKTLLGTCREARQRQGRMSVYEGAFFSPTLACNPNPLGQPFLTMTADNNLTLSTTETGRGVPIARTARKKEMVTKL